jgi:uncharacterized membrane protein SpoIIM required for sporulation
MKETFFIKQNKKKWEEFEEEFSRTHKDPEKLSSLFMQITDDLSYSRTYYPNRSVKIYLNNLAQKVFSSVYKNRTRKRKRFISYWTDELPKVIFENRLRLLFAFLLFIISMAIGILSSNHDPAFARQILGDSYVEMTEKNIAEGDPMKVYKNADSTEMFFGITWNNLQVAFFTFILGMLFGLGTTYIIVINGVMLGVFQYFFIERDLFRESFLAIWVHGALEICAIVIAGAAGFELAKGLLFPGTYTRLQAFRKSAMRGIKVFTAIVPVIIVAGFNEGFLTRHTQVSDWVRASLICIEFSFMLFYYVYYPWKKSKQGFAIDERPEELPPPQNIKIYFDTVKTNGSAFSDAFLLFGRNISFLMKTGACISLLFVVCFWIIYANTNFEIGRHLEAGNLFIALVSGLRLLTNVLKSCGDIYVYFINTACFAGILAIAAYCIHNTKREHNVTVKDFFLFALRSLPVFILSAAVFFGLLFIDVPLKFLLAMLLLPYLCMFVTQVTAGDGNLQERLQLLFFKTHFLNLMILCYALLLISIITITLGNFILFYFLSEFAKLNLQINNVLFAKMQAFTVLFMLMFNTYVLFTAVFFNMAFVYFSHREINTAQNLLQRIGKLSPASTKQ